MSGRKYTTNIYGSQLTLSEPDETEELESDESEGSTVEEQDCNDPTEPSGICETTEQLATKIEQLEAQNANLAQKLDNETFERIKMAKEMEEVKKQMEQISLICQENASLKSKLKEEENERTIMAAKLDNVKKQVDILKKCNSDRISRIGRLEKELELFNNDNNDTQTYRLFQKDANLNNWIFKLTPQQEPYAGGTFRICLLFPDNFPFVAPNVRFMTQILHPNVKKGNLQMEMLSSWSPAYHVKDVIENVVHLLSNPELTEPVETGLAWQYENDKELFNLMAKKYTREFAVKP